MADNILTQVAEGVKSGVLGLAGQQAAGATGAKAAQTKKSKYKKPEDVVYNDPAEIYKAIIANAGQTDPTVGGTVTAQAISPITNAPISGTAGSPGSVYSSTAYAADFVGGGLTSEYDQKYKRYYIAKTDPYGVKHEVAIIGDPNNPGAYRVVDKLQAIQEVIGQYKNQKGGISALKQQMWQRGALTGAKGKQSIAAGNNLDNAFVAALASYIDELTATNFNNSDTKQFKTFGDQLATSRSYAGTRTSVNYGYTPKDIAAQDITSFIQGYLGRGATAKEIADYTKALEEFERQHPQKSVITTDALGIERKRITYAGASEADKTAVKVAVLSKALTEKGINPSAISAGGGAIAQGMDQLKQTAAAYGIVGYDDAKALSAMANIIKPGGDIKAEQEKMKQMAKVTYKNLAASIDSGLTVKDVAEQYAYYNQKILEKPGVVDVFDPYIQTALHNEGKSGLMSTTDYVKYLKSQPEWAKTQNAREEAASYATTILKQFGLMA